MTVHHHGYGDIWTTTDGGVHWTDQTGSRVPFSDPLFDSLASSADGTKLAAAVLNDDAPLTTTAIITSADGGVTWSNATADTNTTGDFFEFINSSADGNKLVVVDENAGDIWTGVISTPPTPPPTLAPSGGGWSGGCSTYPQGELPSWGVIPCTPTNPSQGPAVLPGTPASPTPTSSPPSIQAQGSTTENGAGITLPKNHQMWDQGDDIRILQKFFNTHGFIIAVQGPGSPGNETSIFGSKTYQALIKFQKANNLPPTGYFGPLTRALINSKTQPSSAATSTTQ